MDPRFETYAAAVSRWVNHATAKELAAIRKELADHMEDHAQALLDAGYDADHAHRVALEAMGDPEEVGRALNREYPLRWLVLLRLSLVLALLGGMMILLVFPGGLYNSMVARLAPMSSGFHSTTLDEDLITPTHIRAEYPNGDILWIYATAVTWDDQRGYVGHLYTVTYNRNPIRDPYYSTYPHIFTLRGSEEELLRGGGGGSSYGAAYFHWRFEGIPKDSTLVARYDQYGTAFTLEIPLPWEEVDLP